MRVSLLIFSVIICLCDCRNVFMDKAKAVPTEFPGCTWGSYIEEETISIINTMRFNNGKTPLYETYELTRTAALHAQDVMNNYNGECAGLYHWSANRPEGVNWSACCADDSYAACIQNKPMEINHAKQINDVEGWIELGKFETTLDIQNAINLALGGENPNMRNIIQSETARNIGVALKATPNRTRYLSIYISGDYDWTPCSGTVAPSSPATTSWTTSTTSWLATTAPTQPPSQGCFPTDFPGCNIEVVGELVQEAFFFINEKRATINRSVLGGATELFGTAALHVQDLASSAPSVCQTYGSQYENYKWTKYSPLVADWRGECCGHAQNIESCIHQKVLQIYELTADPHAKELVIKADFEITSRLHVRLAIEAAIVGNPMFLPFLEEDAFSLGAAVRGRYISLFVAKASLTHCLGFPLPIFTTTTAPTNPTTTAATSTWVTTDTTRPTSTETTIETTDPPVSYPTQWPDECEAVSLLARAAIEYLRNMRAQENPTAMELIAYRPLCGTAAYHVQDLVQRSSVCSYHPLLDMYEWSESTPEGVQWTRCCPNNISDLQCTITKPEEIYGVKVHPQEVVMINEVEIRTVDDVISTINSSMDGLMFPIILDTEYKYIGAAVQGQYLSVYVSKNAAPAEFCNDI